MESERLSIQLAAAGGGGRPSCCYFPLSPDRRVHTVRSFVCVFSVAACCLDYSKWSIIFIEFNSIKGTFVEKVNFHSCFNNTKEDSIASSEKDDFLSTLLLSSMFFTKEEKRGENKAEASAWMKNNSINVKLPYREFQKRPASAMIQPHFDFAFRTILLDASIYVFIKEFQMEVLYPMS